MGSRDRVSVVMITRNRRDRALATVARLCQLDERPPVIVVDNGSTDGTAGAVEAAYPGVRVVRLPSNLGAAGRNCGVALAATPYVAFSDDDSWWAPGALTIAASLLDAHPRLAVVAARVDVGAEGRVDPVCREMAASPLRTVGAPGRAVLGFVACGSVVRRRAFLDVGGFRLEYGVGGEEEPLAVDLAAAGWDIRYCDEVVAHHDPSTARPPGEQRRRLQTRNALRTAWLRRRAPGAARATARIVWAARDDPAARAGVGDALGDLRWLWHERAPVPPAVEAQISLL